MLVLCRKKDEEIVLPGLGVSLRVLRIRGQKVSLGVTAPANQPVHRGEVWEAIKGTVVEEVEPCEQQREDDGQRGGTGNANRRPRRRSA